jgi:hypothetical protein
MCSRHVRIQNLEDSLCEQAFVLSGCTLAIHQLHKRINELEIHSTQNVETYRSNDPPSTKSIVTHLPESNSPLEMLSYSDCHQSELSSENQAGEIGAISNPQESLPLQPEAHEPVDVHPCEYISDEIEAFIAAVHVDESTRFDCDDFTCQSRIAEPETEPESTSTTVPVMDAEIMDAIPFEVSSYLLEHALVSIMQTSLAEKRDTKESTPDKQKNPGYGFESSYDAFNLLFFADFLQVISD